MYADTITVFNRYEGSVGIFWYPHVLSGVHFEDDKAQILKKYGPESSDKAQLHVKCEKRDKNVFIKDADSKLLNWLPPKSWKRQGNDDLEASITFSGEDFFIVGAWEGETPVNDADYARRQYSDFYGYMNSNMDYVYKITTVGRYDVIPHFEILGA